MKNLGQINDPKDIVTKEYVDSQISSNEADLTDYVKNTDYATADKAGVVKINSNSGLRMYSGGTLYCNPATNEEIDAKTQQFKPITPSTLDYAVKSVGDGYYVTDTDYATADKGGVVKIRPGYGLNSGNGVLTIRGAKETDIDAKNEYMPITPKYLEYAVKSVGDGYYALASTITALENRIAQLESQLAGVEAQLAEI